MPTVFQHRRYNSANVATIVGSPGELIVDLEQNLGRGELTLHDGIIAGGIPVSFFRIGSGNTFIYSRESNYNISIGKSNIIDPGYKLDVNGSIQFVGSISSKNGIGTTITGNNIINLGEASDITGNNIFVTGYDNIISGDRVIVAGLNQIITGSNVFGFGVSLSITHDSSMVIGFGGSSKGSNTIDITGEKIYLTGDSFTNNLIPQSNIVYDLGSTSNWWNNLYVKNLIVNDIIPSVNLSFTLGNTSFWWAEVYSESFIGANASLNDLYFTNNIYGDYLNSSLSGSKIVNLGSNSIISSNQASIIFGSDSSIYGTNSALLGSNVSITHNNVIVIGGNYTSESDNQVVISSPEIFLSGNTITTNIIPKYDKQYNIGSESLYYQDTYIDTLHVNHLLVGNTTFYASRPQYYKLTQANTSSSQIDLPSVGLAKSIQILIDHTEWIVEDEYTEVLNSNGHVTAVNPLYNIPSDSVVVIRYSELIS